MRAITRVCSYLNLALFCFHVYAYINTDSTYFALLAGVCLVTALYGLEQS